MANGKMQMSSSQGELITEILWKGLKKCIKQVNKDFFVKIPDETQKAEILECDWRNIFYFIHLNFYDFLTIEICKRMQIRPLPHLQ